MHLIEVVADDIQSALSTPEVAPQAGNQFPGTSDARAPDYVAFHVMVVTDRQYGAIRRSPNGAR